MFTQLRFVLPPVVLLGLIISIVTCHAADLPGTVTVHLPGKVLLKLVPIEAGTFTMGRRLADVDIVGRRLDTTFEVTLTRPFLMGKYEVTRAQWAAVMGTEPWYNHPDRRNSPPRSKSDSPDIPATAVTWEDAEAFVTALSKLTGKTFRLPTEAEWEYAARAGTTTALYWGEDPALAPGYAWCAAGSNDEPGQARPQRVGQKQPNAWGLYDMVGNVGEYVQDWYAPAYPAEPAIDPAGPPKKYEMDKVMRGGSIVHACTECRSCDREPVPVDCPSGIWGFRVVMEPAF